MTALPLPEPDPPRFYAIDPGRLPDHGARPAADTAASPEMALGTLLHAALCTAMRLREAGSTVTPRLIQQIWDDEWQTEGGWVRRAHPELFAKGAQMLRAYITGPHFQDARIFRLPTVQPDGSLAPGRPMLEFPFRIDLGDGRSAVGRFDRVDEREGKPVVVDYKTGIPGVDGVNPYRDQLLLYAIAIADMTGVTEVDCEIHWLQNDVVAQIHFSPSDLSAGRAKAVAWALRNPPPEADNGGPALGGEGRGPDLGS